MKVVKRLVKFVLLLLVLAGIAAAVIYYRSNQQPEWYAHVETYDPAKSAEAAQRAQNKLIATQQWAAGREAAEIRANSGAEPAGTTQPAGSAAPKPLLSVAFTEEELNAIFRKWSDAFGWEQSYGQHLSNPGIVLHEGRIILAGTVKELGRVVSLHFEPKLDADNGRLRLDLESVMAGRLPMPQGLFEGYRERLKNRVMQSLPPQQQAARLSRDGAVNGEAMNAAMGQLLVAVLNRRTSEPVLFLQGNGGRNVPVKLVDVKVEGESVSLSVEMMTPQERQAWLQRLRGPYGTVTARGAEDDASADSKLQ